MKIEPRVVGARSSLSSRAARAAYGLWGRVKTRRAGVPSGTVFEGVPDDRFQALRSLYLWVGEQVADRRVLDLSGGATAGIESLLVAGAKRLVVVAGSSAIWRYVERRHDNERLELFLRQAPSGEVFDLVLMNPTAQGEPQGELAPVLERLHRGGRLMVYRALVGDASLGPRPSPGEGSTRQQIETHFLRCQRVAHRLPPGYSPDWTSRVPARARAQEYRFESIDLHSDLPEETLGEVWCGSTPRSLLPPGSLRLHVGSGMEPLEGWLNVDLLPLPGVDLTLDVTEDFHFSGVEAIYAEHFLEHLEILDVLDFLANAHSALADSGLLRLSTPNLDWVWQTHYQREADSSVKVAAALSVNRAFYGWGHRFVWNRELLEQALIASGFEDLGWPSYGESRWEVLRNLERHETYPDYGDLSHVLIVEARKGAADPEAAKALRRRLKRDFVDQVKGWEAVDLSTVRSTPRLNQ